MMVVLQDVSVVFKDTSTCGQYLESNHQPCGLLTALPTFPQPPHDMNAYIKGGWPTLSTVPKHLSRALQLLCSYLLTWCVRWNVIATVFQFSWLAKLTLGKHNRTSNNLGLIHALFYSKNQNRSMVYKIFVVLAVSPCTCRIDKG